MLGFNLGIELGQALFVTAVLAVLAAARGLRTRWTRTRVRAMHFAADLSAAQMASLAALLVGTFWLLERVGV